MNTDKPISIICPLCHNIAEDINIKNKTDAGATIYPKGIRLRGKKQGSSEEYLDIEKATIEMNPPCYLNFTCKNCDADIAIISNKTLVTECDDVKGKIER